MLIFKGFCLFCIAVEFATTSVDVSLETFFPQIGKDYSNITWAHAVNSRRELKNALSGDVMMLEADISIGEVIGSSGANEPIMAHPPIVISDINFEDWLTEVITQQTKGIKLDFKSTAVLEPSLQVLKGKLPQIKFPVWINADILPGPVNASTKPVEASLFLKLCQLHFPHSTISPGWTTFVNSSLLTKNKRLSWQNVLDMVLALRDAKINQSVTFPVRAVFVCLSINQLQWLLDVVPSSSLTIWSSPTDQVDVRDLLVLRHTFPINRIFYDLPAPLHAEFHRLKNVPDSVRLLNKFTYIELLQNPLFQHDASAIVGSHSVILLDSSVVNFTFRLAEQERSSAILLLKGTFEFLESYKNIKNDSSITMCINSNATLKIHLKDTDKIQICVNDIWDGIQFSKNSIEFEFSLLQSSIAFSLSVMGNTSNNQRLRYEDLKLYEHSEGEAIVFEITSNGPLPKVLSRLTTSDLCMASFVKSSSTKSSCIPLIITVLIAILIYSL